MLAPVCASADSTQCLSLSAASLAAATHSCVAAYHSVHSVLLLPPLLLLLLPLLLLLLFQCMSLDACHSVLTQCLLCFFLEVLSTVCPRCRQSDHQSGLDRAGDEGIPAVVVALPIAEWSPPRLPVQRQQALLLGHVALQEVHCRWFLAATFA